MATGYYTAFYILQDFKCAISQTCHWKHLLQYFKEIVTKKTQIMSNMICNTQSEINLMFEEGKPPYNDSGRSRRCQSSGGQHPDAKDRRQQVMCNKAMPGQQTALRTKTPSSGLHSHDHCILNDALGVHSKNEDMWYKGPWGAASFRWQGIIRVISNWTYSLMIPTQRFIRNLQECS